MSQTVRQVADGIDLAQYEEREGKIRRRKDKFVEVEAMSKGKVIRQSLRQPNKTELRFEQEYLKPWLMAMDIFKYDYEAVTLKIANGCRYTPDWYVVEWLGGDGTSKGQFYEVKAKGNIHDDAIVKLKCAAASFPQFEFYLCTYHGKLGWTLEKVLA